LPVLLALARGALWMRQYAQAETILHRARDLGGDSPELRTLMGLLHESLGEPHAAYWSYRAALHVDRSYKPALTSVRQYCERFGFDVNNGALNPGAGQRVGGNNLH
jgi:hypothetical protein